MEEGLEEVFSPGATDRYAATTWATSQVISIENEFHEAASMQMYVLFSGVVNEAGFKQTTMNANCEK